MTISGDAPASGVRARAPSRRFEAKRLAIIASAVTEINRKGVRGMTLGDVAARLGLVPTGVIYYFKNKEELAAAAFQATVARWEQLVADSEGPDTGRGRIAALVAGHMELRARIRLGEDDQIADLSDLRALNCASVNDAYVQMFRRARRLLERIPGESRADRNGRAVLLLAELTWTPAWIHNWRTEDYGRLAQRMTAILQDGIAAPDRPWPPAAPLILNPEPGSEDEALPENFLKAATHLINDEGYHGASVDRISSRLKVTKGAFYHYNDTKDDLVAACFQRTFDILWRAIDAAEAAGGPGLDRLVSMTIALVRLQLSDAPLLRTSALSTVPPALRDQLLNRLRRITIRIASMLCDGIADGSVRPVDTSITAQMITAAINAASELPYWRPDGSADETADHYARSLFQGLFFAEDAASEG